MRFYDGRILSTAILCLAATSIAIGQSAPTKSNATTRGTLSGRVFAMTAGGDLKPARMADVYVLYSAGLTRDGKAMDSGETADLVFMEAHNTGQEEYNQEFRAHMEWTDKQACMKDLATFHPAMLKVIDWADAHKKGSQLIKTQTDEEGNFSVSLPPGMYGVYVRGRAGFNEALWDSGLDYARVQPGSHIVMKLSKPTTSCVDFPE
jgi:hypothetical protein